MHYIYFLIGVLSALPASAQIVTEQPTTQSSGTSRDDLALYINSVLGLLSFLAVVFFFIGLLKWLTAGGQSSRSTPARKTMISSAIALIVLLFAWGITLIVLNAIG